MSMWNNIDAPLPLRRQTPFHRTLQLVRQLNLSLNRPIPFANIERKPALAELSGREIRCVLLAVDFEDSAPGGPRTRRAQKSIDNLSYPRGRLPVQDGGFHLHFRLTLLRSLPVSLFE